MPYLPYIFKQIGLVKVFNVFYRGPYEPPSRSDWTPYPRGPIASQGGSVPVFLRKLKATCDFPGVCVCRGSEPPPPPPPPHPPPLDPPMAWLEYSSLFVIHLLYSIHLYRPQDENANLNIIFHISKPKRMLWVLEKSVSI